MSGHRQILLAIVAAVLISQGAEAARCPNNKILGAPVEGDDLLLSDIVEVPSKWFRVVERHKTYRVDSSCRISQVCIIDRNNKGKGATATVVAGGPGYTFVIIHFKSERGHSIDFVVDVYGR